MCNIYNILSALLQQKTTPFTSHNDLHLYYKCINNKVDSETETSIHTHTYIIKIEKDML